VASGVITFGSFNNLMKLSPATLCLWARVLAAVPGSMLALKGNVPDADAFRARLAQAGLPVERCRLLPRTVGLVEHLATYAQIDIALDPVTYHGTTTTCEALWMGRPVVSLAGESHVRRVGVSLLTAEGQADCVAGSEDEFVEIAVRIATDRVALGARCAGLSAALAASPLLDYAGQAARFGEALRERCRIIAMSKTDPLPRLKEALAHHQAGRLEQALRLYADVRRLAPRNFDAWNLAGVAAHRLGRQEEAAALLAQALKLLPESPLAWRHLALVQLALNKFAQAETCLRRSLSRDAKSVESWEALSITYHQMGRLPEALEAAVQAARLRPDLVSLDDRVASLTADLHGYRAALPLLEAMTKRWPEHAPAWKNLGIAQASLHEPWLALDALDRALAINPELTMARLGRAMAWLEAFRLPEAIADYDAVLAREPANSEAGSARLFALNYRDDVTPDALWDTHREYGRVHGSVAPRVLPLLAPGRCAWRFYRQISGVTRWLRFWNRCLRTPRSGALRCGYITITQSWTT